MGQIVDWMFILLGTGLFTMMVIKSYIR